MTTILKGYQFRLYPSDAQKKLINQTIGVLDLYIIIF